MWGQVSFGKATIQSSSTKEIGDHDMDVTGSITKALWYTTVAPTDHLDKNGKLFIKLWSDESYVEVRFASGSVVEGDIVRVETAAFYAGNQTLGYKVDGSGDKVTKAVTDQEIHAIDQALTSANIKHGDGYDYIRISRNGLTGCGYHSVEILTNRLTASQFKSWERIDGNTSTGVASGGAVNTTLGINVAAGGTVFGDGNVYYLNYVNVKGGSGAIMPDAKSLIIEGNPGVALRILFNRVSDGGSNEESNVTIPSDGKLIFDISSYDTFHLNAIKIPWNESTGNVVNAIKLSNEGSVGYTVTFGVVDRDNNAAADRGTVTATVNGDPIVSGTRVPDGTRVTFSVTSNDPKYLSWGWYKNGTRNYGQPTVEETVTADLTMNAVLNQGVTFNAYPNNGSLGDVRVWLDETEKGTTFTTNPGTTTITFRATPKSGATFVGWYPNSSYNDAERVSTEAKYTVSDPNHGLDLFAKFESTFTPELDLNSSDKGSNVVSYTGGVLTVKGGSDNGVKVKDITGQGSNYTGIRLTTQGDACRIIVRWGEADATQKVTVVDAAEKATTSYYSWSMLGVPENQVANLTSIRFFGAADGSYSDSNRGVTTFSNASLVNVKETTPYTRVVGELREFNLNDTRVQLYGHDAHYQMGGNINWVYKEETGGDKFVTMKTTGTSWNQMEIFNSGHGASNADGVCINHKGQHFRVIVYTTDKDAEDNNIKFTYTVSASDSKTETFLPWAMFKKDGVAMTAADVSKILRIEVAGCSDHSDEEAVNFYGLRLHKDLAEVIYTDESKTTGSFNGISTLTYTETLDGKNMKVAFHGVTALSDRHEAGCNGVIMTNSTVNNFVLDAPAGHKIAKVIVGLGESTNSKATFNEETKNISGDKVEWTNNTATKSVTMSIPGDAANPLHVTYIYYELAEEEINSIEVNGMTRQYDVYVPEGLTSGTVGVVFSLHGASKDYYDDSGRINFNAIADAQKATAKQFIVVYPRGIMRELRGQERGWATYNEDNVEDVEFFKAIVTELKNTYTVDMDRIYLAGYANGGMMAYKAAHQAGDFFKAFASVGGFPVNESHLYHAGVQPTPFMHIQGERDEIFNDTEYNFYTISHNMTYRNGAHFNAYDTSNNSDGGVVADNANVTKEIHVADAGGAAYFLYYIKDMTHVPSYDWTGDHVDDVAQSIWNFFDYSGKVNNIDPTLKFRMSDPGQLWKIATTGKANDETPLPDGGYIGFDKVNETVDGIHYVLTYGGRTNTGGAKGTEFNRDSANKNMWHSLQFNGGINGAPHFLKLNVQTDDVHGAEVATDYFLVKLTKTGESTPVFAKRYQAGRGQKDLYINFAALPGFNEYKLEVTKSRSNLTVMVHGMEFYSGSCSEKGQEENPVFFTDVKTIVSELKPIYQPIYGTTFDALAKEYIPIANIPIGEIAETHVATSTTRHYKVIEDNLKVNGTVLKETLDNGKLPSQWGATTTSTTVTGTGYKNLYVSGHSDEKDPSTRKVNNIAYILGSNNYTVDPVKGLNISQHGRAQMVEYLNGTVGNFPTKGMLAFKFEGTCDFTLLAENDITYDDDGNGGRSTLKIYYTNDQLDGELKELKEWWFYGTRSEVGGNDNIKNGDASHEEGNSLNVLSANIRLPQLGKDGTCTVFVTYEGRKNNGVFSHESGDDNKIWIKGFVIKRPDLKVTIGRTDNLYKDQNRGYENNTSLTRFGENKPYIWSFENVGFNNTRRRTVDGELEDDTQEKKVNVNDWRTYVCGGTDDSFDHLLVYSDVTSSSKDDKAQFDGRVAGQEHIEFRKPSQYLMKDNPADASNGRLEFNPITSNGLKVNVTGSGWFKIKCSAPNGKVKMKVFSSTNYGISYTNLLREFVVDNSTHPSSSTGEEEHHWGEYTVYLKGHVEREWTDTGKKMAGFWDGDKIKYSEDEADNAEEKVRMSLYVVFDEIEGVDYKEDGNPSGADATAQLNIHQLSWLNEEPADYVFQREEDPKLLTTWQAIRRDGEGKKTMDDSTNDNVVLWWKAGNDDDAAYPMLKENGQDTYDRLGQYTTSIANQGVKSPGGYASTSVPSDAGSYDAYWDIAAPASTNSHTETAYAKGNIEIDSSSPQYDVNAIGNTEFDIPVSGSFIRICAMKNTYVVAHVIPEKTTGENGTIYVLDETGAQIPLNSGGDDANRRGYIADKVNGGEQKGGILTDGTTTIRVDFIANAGKEYFICGNNAKISLARLEVHDWRNWTHKPTTAYDKLELADGATDNSSKITTAYDNGVTYMDANLHRKVGSNWISLVLPFSMNEKKFEEVFGKGARCIHFTGVDIPNKTVKLTHHYYNMIVAGRPVFVKPGTSPNVDASGYLKDIKDVTLQTKTVSTYTTSDGVFEFFGSYDNTTMERNDLFMNNANAIKYLTDESATYPGMRSFVKNHNGPDFYTLIGSSSTSTGAKAMFLNFCDLDEDAATGIEELISAEFGENAVVVTKSTKAYDLNGRVVAEGADINSLPAGIYVVNGKKYAVVK